MLTLTTASIIVFFVTFVIWFRLGRPIRSAREYTAFIAHCQKQAQKAVPLVTYVSTETHAILPETNNNFKPKHCTLLQTDVKDFNEGFINELRSNIKWENKKCK